MDTLRRPAGIIIVLLTAGLGLWADLYSKALSVQRLSAPASPYDFIPGYLQFTFVENHGAVFGFGQGGRWIFVAVSIAAIAFVAYLFAKSPRRWWYDVALGMLLAGILGNLYDRVFIGYVRDMIHALPRWPGVFPWVFNIADSLLCVSIGVLLVTGLFTPEEKADDRHADGT